MNAISWTECDGRERRRARRPGAGNHRPPRATPRAARGALRGRRAAISHTSACGRRRREVVRRRDEARVERASDQQHRHVDARQVCEQRRLRRRPERAQARGQLAGIVREARTTLVRAGSRVRAPLRREQRLRQPLVDECLDADAPRCARRAPRRRAAVQRARPDRRCRRARRSAPARPHVPDGARRSRARAARPWNSRASAHVRARRRRASPPGRAALSSNAVATIARAARPSAVPRQVGRQRVELAARTQRDTPARLTPAAGEAVQQHQRRPPAAALDVQRAPASRRSSACSAASARPRSVRVECGVRRAIDRHFDHVQPARRARATAPPRTPRPSQPASPASRGRAPARTGRVRAARRTAARTLRAAPRVPRAGIRRCRRRRRCSRRS